MCYSLPASLGQADDEMPGGNDYIYLKWWRWGNITKMLHFVSRQGHIIRAATWKWVACVHLLPNIPSGRQAGCGTLPSQNKQEATNITSTDMKRTWGLVPLNTGSVWVLRAELPDTVVLLLQRGCKPDAQLAHEHVWPKPAKRAVRFENKSALSRGASLKLFVLISATVSEVCIQNRYKWIHCRETKGSAGIHEHFHKSQTMDDLTQHAHQVQPRKEEELWLKLTVYHDSNVWLMGQPVPNFPRMSLFPYGKI